MKLINNTKSTSRIGTLVKLDPRDPGAFVYVEPSDTTALGVVASSVPYRQSCEVITYGAAQVLVSGNVSRGNVVRARKSTDGISAGVCKVATAADVPYLQVGIALESGRGLVSCEIRVQYLGLDGTGTSTQITVGPTEPTDPNEGDIWIQTF